MQISTVIVKAIGGEIDLRLTGEAAVKAERAVEKVLADLRDVLVERARTLERAAAELAGVPEMATAITEMRARARGLRAAAEALVDDGEIPF
jgi:hypothetical protein